MGYAISCGHELTTEAAETVLKAGGNVFDAIVAAFAASWVVEPCMSGPGGGGFAVILHEGQTTALDFFTKTPGRKRSPDEIDFRPVTVNFGGTTEVFHYGLGSVAVPGAVDGLFTLYDMGARMPLTELMQPAIRYASEGHDLVPFQRYDMELLREIIFSAERGRELFFKDDQLHEPGDLIRLPNLADFLDHLSREGREAFYKGEISKRIEDDSLTSGGHLLRSDLEQYHSKRSKGNTFAFDSLQITTPGGLSVGSKILEAIVRRTVASKKQDHLGQIMEGMLQVHGLKAHWFDPNWNVKQGGTSHMNVIDGSGNAVSLSMSLGEGSGYFIEGTDIQMNNMLGEAALLPSGWHSWTPDVRLQSMMTPVVAFDPVKEATLAMGSGGASRIPFAIAQVIDNYMRRSMATEDAVNAPRVHWNGELWQAEPGVIRPSYLADDQWNAWPHQSLYFGGVHVSESNDGTFEAVGDGRRDGISSVSN